MANIFRAPKKAGPSSNKKTGPGKGEPKKPPENGAETPEKDPKDT